MRTFLAPRRPYAMPDLTFSRRFVLVAGALIAAANFVGWTFADYQRYGVFTLNGTIRALFVLTAVLGLYLVLRLAALVLGRNEA